MKLHNIIITKAKYTFCWTHSSNFITKKCLYLVSSLKKKTRYLKFTKKQSHCHSRKKERKKKSKKCVFLVSSLSGWVTKFKIFSLGLCLLFIVLFFCKLKLVFLYIDSKIYYTKEKEKQLSKTHIPGQVISVNVGIISSNAV